MPMKTLILGGIKSGKSRYSEETAGRWNGPKHLIATATANDQAMTDRINRHKAERGADFNVIEEPIYLGTKIKQYSASDCVIVDCLTLWITNLLLLPTDETSIEHERSDFIESISQTPSRILIVSNESNMGIIPLGELSRRYCDEIGLLHQALGKMCDEVYLMVAGVPLKIK